MQSILRITLLLILLTPLKTYAAGFVPIVYSHSALDYKGGLQNWSCAQSADGVMYFGNNNGLLSYDGYKWRLTQVAGGGIVRSVMVDGKRVYVGADREFGYFERNTEGQLKYTSLWPKNYKHHNDEIWNIFRTTSGHIIFQSFSSWFDYDGKSKVVPRFNDKFLPLWLFPVQERIYAQQVNHGFCDVTSGSPRTLLELSQYGNSSVVAALPTVNSGNLMLVTSRSGIYVYNGTTATPWANQANDALRHDIVNKALLWRNQAVIVGTIKNGIYAISLADGRILWHLNKTNGLNDNTVLGMTTDSDGNIWVALDNGISVVYTGLPLTVLHTGMVGMVYGVSHLGSTMYIATNQALWHYDGTKPTIVSGTEDQNWYVQRFGNQIFCGNNLYTMQVHGTTATPMPGVNMGSTSIKECNFFGQQVLIESSYSGLRVYRKVDGQWTFANVIDGFDNKVQDFEVDRSGVVWATNVNKGLYKIELSHDMKRVTDVKYYEKLGDDSTENDESVHLGEVQGRVLISSGSRLYTYDDLNHRIIPFESFNSIFKGGILATASVDNSLCWFMQPDGFSLVNTAGQAPSVLTYLPIGIFGQECNINAKPIAVDGSYTYFFLSDGVGRFDNREPSATPSKYRLGIASVTTSDADNHLQFLTTDGGDDASVDGNIHLSLSFPNYTRQRYIFRFVLDDDQNTLYTSEIPEATFSNLSYGKHELTISVNAPDGRSLDSLTYTFHNPRPWYLSIWALIVYLVALHFAIYYYVRWRTAKIVARNQEIAEQKLVAERMKVMEQEQIIADQQKILLENELQAKSKEMASMAFGSIAMQNSVQELKTAIQDTSIDQKNRRTLENLLKQIETNGTDEAWQVYQKNFDLIHEKFFRKLKERYPGLTYTDLKFCALLRLNYNTKDIAKFTNLTIRGVEGARYRLRKKLALPENKSLTEFLIEFE